MTISREGGEPNVKAIVLLTVVGAVVGMAAGPFVPGSPDMPIVGPIAEPNPTPWVDNEATSIRIAYQNATPPVAAAASGGVSVRPRGALGTVPLNTMALNGVQRIRVD